MFNIGEYAVCPGHGVGQISNIEERDVGTEKKLFYIVKVISNGLTIMVPTDSINGIRELVSANDVDDVYQLLSNHDVKLDNSTWNRRYREYMNKIKTGSILEIADVLRSLLLLKGGKNLSFGEKKMMEQCKDLLTIEMSLVDGAGRKEVDQRIDSCFN
ncbi:MAG: CarD family transcriptional regulator [Bdellovibrionales bacterium]|jgi:CarD family transcriptional regulator|nr:CarD family transcriptional regulator [Bdellovibrionales bacterium]MBT3525278.1 CarD family transcriptional regulator [Bdellovibrionales bacterium]MBT7668584.1 CarD family transcriptional regulator [Bdellovibrionales bacterium]MBT7767431.1 CarD family transcriptional regulator [Bdellovibrionales bacterium]